MNQWRCTVCGHQHQGKKPPASCPVCGAHLYRFVLNQPVAGDLEPLVRAVFAAEAKAQARNRAFAEQADLEGLPAVARLFRAVSEAEGVHAGEMLKYLAGVVGTSQENLQTAFENEIKAKNDHYPEMIKAAHAAKREDLAWSLVRARDVEARHADLYKNALAALAGDREVDYHVCRVCGYVFDGALPDKCPVCASGPDQFQRVA